jgi:prepilin-type N-terminal cleavage/methylation domain-containing protein
MTKFLRKKNQKGFTLLEVMLVVIIIGIIAIIALPRLLVTRQEARLRSCDSNLQAIRTQLEEYYWMEGHYPDLTSAPDVEDFLIHTNYPDYWPEDSTVSSDCPIGSDYVYTRTSDSRAAVTCPIAEHSAN